MALDNKHHLEGVLLQPRLFRVYLYDVYTKPLSAAQVQQTKGSVQVGEAANAPTLELAVGRDGQTLETTLGPDLKLPVTLTLYLRFPGTPPSARPEVFTFPFSHYIPADAAPPAAASTSHAGHDMGGMDMGK